MNWLDYWMFFILIFIYMISVLLGVAFLTLLERKILGYIQLRKGPNKVGFLGLIQPFSDAMKLFVKELIYPVMSNLYVFYMCPVLMLFISLIFWLLIPFYSLMLHFSYGILFFLCLSSLSVYFIMLSGWSSNSNYSLLGSLRSVAQVISYEVVMVMCVMLMLMYIYSYMMVGFCIYQFYLWFVLISVPVAMLMYLSLLAETNRSPFDFAEGESELVSGFNVEYSGVGFVLIFISEYLMIMMMSFIFSIIFMGGNLLSFNYYLMIVFVMFLFLWIRGTLPRIRYDQLMYMCWKSLLPFSLNLFMIFYGTSLINLVLFYLLMKFSMVNSLGKTYFMFSKYKLIKFINYFMMKSHILYINSFIGK